MMGRHHARVLGALDGVELVAVADPPATRTGGRRARPVHRSVEELIDGRARLLRGRRADRLPRARSAWRWPTPASTPWSRSRWPRTATAPAGSPRRSPPAAWSAPSATSSGTTPRCSTCGARLEHGELGDVYQIVTRRQGPFPARIADVGVVKDLATHDIDLTAWVARSRFRSVAARTAYKSGREFEDLVAVVGSSTTARSPTTW